MKSVSFYSVAGELEIEAIRYYFFIYKEDKLALIISARDMTHRERRKYEHK